MIRRLIAGLTIAAALTGLSLPVEAAPERPTTHTVQHRVCQYWAVTQVTGGAPIDQWPWYLTGFSTPFYFQGHWVTRCEVKNVYYGFPVYTCAFVRINGSAWGYINC